MLLVLPSAPRPVVEASWKRIARSTCGRAAHQGVLIQHGAWLGKSLTHLGERVLVRVQHCVFTAQEQHQQLLPLCVPIQGLGIHKGYECELQLSQEPLQLASVVLLKDL